MPTPYIGCVYLATNTANGKVYIGKSIRGMEKRRRAHEVNGAALTAAFKAAMKKYGNEAFIWREIFLSDDDQALRLAEVGLIAAYRAAGFCLYNMTDGGDGCAGRKLIFSVVHRARIGKSRASVNMPPWTPERRAKMERSWALRKSLGINKMSDAAKAKQSEAAKRRCDKAALSAAGKLGAASRWGKRPG